MKTFLFFTFFAAAIFHISFSVVTIAKPEKFGVDGRYCTHGTYKLGSNTIININDNEFCGLHPFTPGSCVSMTYSDNTVKMGCDNDNGFPTCNHDSDTDYMNSNGVWIRCCNDDHCNDCTKNMLSCYYPEQPTTPPPTTTPPSTTTTTTLPPTTTTTHKSNANVSNLNYFVVFSLCILFGFKTLKAFLV